MLNRYLNFNNPNDGSRYGRDRRMFFPGCYFLATKNGIAQIVGGCPECMTACAVYLEFQAAKTDSANPLSEWLASVPYAERACDLVRWICSTLAGAVLEIAHLSRNCPTRDRQRTSASADLAIPVVPHRHKRVDRVGPREREPFSPAFQWRGQCGRFLCGIRGTEVSPCAFRCRLGRVSLPRAFRGGGRR